MEELNPLVSVIIPTYNRVGLIGETLQSLKDQTYQHWQALVVDDGSTDGTRELIENFAASEKRIQLFKRDRQPKGAPTCRNIGIEKSSGDYLIFLDSDDLLADFCIERRVTFFKKYPDEDFLVFQSLLFEKKIDDKNLLWNVDNDEDDLERFLRIDALWSTCGPIYKKAVISQIGGFREGLPFYQDFDLHLRVLFLKYDYKKFLNESPDCFKRHHFDNSISNSIAFTSDLNILQKRIDFYFIQLTFIRENKIQLTRIQKDAVYGIVFYFCNRYLIEHNNIKSYYKNWFKVRNSLSINLLRHSINFMVPVLTALQKRSKYFIKIKRVYCTFFKRYIADEQLISDSTLYKIKLLKSDRVDQY